jgi:hypothetical protein
MSEKGPYELKTYSGDRFVVVEGDACILMEAFAVEYDDIWSCLPVKSADPDIWPSQERGKRRLFTDGEVQLKVKSYRANLDSVRNVAWKHILLEQTVVLDEDHSLDIKVRADKSDKIWACFYATNKDIDMEVVECEMTRYRAAAVIDALMSAVNCVAEKENKK